MRVRKGGIVDRQENHSQLRSGNCLEWLTYLSFQSLYQDPYVGFGDFDEVGYLYRESNLADLAYINEYDRLIV